MERGHHLSPIQENNVQMQQINCRPTYFRFTQNCVSCSRIETRYIVLNKFLFFLQFKIILLEFRNSYSKGMCSVPLTHFNFLLYYMYEHYFCFSFFSNKQSECLLFYKMIHVSLVINFKSRLILLIPYCARLHLKHDQVF